MPSVPKPTTPPSYRVEVLRHLTALVELWSSPRFFSALESDSGVQLGNTDGHILWELSYRGTSRPGDIAAGMAIGAPSVSKAIARLERQGWVERHPDPADGRAVLLSLTAAGAERARTLYEIGDRMAERILAEWAPQDIQHLGRLTERFTTGARRFAQELDPGL